MLLKNNRSMLIWFMLNIALFISHFLVIWIFYYFTYDVREAPLVASTLIWAVIITVLTFFYLIEILYILIRFYKFWNRPFFIISDYYQWYALNRFLTYSTLLLFIATTFFALKKIPISFGNTPYKQLDYLIYLIFIPIVVFNGLIIWYTVKYKRIIIKLKKGSNKI